MDPVKKRILNICTELGEDMDSPACQKLREHVKSCPDSAAFVDSVKKTIRLFQRYSPEPDKEVSGRLLDRLELK